MRMFLADGLLGHVLPGGYRLRHPVPEDAQAVLQLIVACDIAEHGEPDTDLEDVLFDWQQLDLGQDAWLVLTDTGQLVGYAAVSLAEDPMLCTFNVHPQHAEQGLNGILIRLAEERARRYLTRSQDSRGAMKCYVAHVNAAGREALAAAGFQLFRYHLRMEIDLQQPPPEPTWPAGTVLRPMVPGQDDRVVYDFIEEAFQRSDHPSAGFGHWRAFMMREDHFSPDLWHLLVADGKLIGLAICYDYKPLGWIRHLGVATHWRRQGVGTALLQHAFGDFYRRGRTRVALGVRAENLDAIGFYERIGMRPVRQFDEYRKTL